MARSLRAVVVNPETGQELPDGRVGEFWLHGDNVGRGYWNRSQETCQTFHARLAAPLPAGSRAEGCRPTLTGCEPVISGCSSMDNSL